MTQRLRLLPLALALCASIASPVAAAAPTPTGAALCRTDIARMLNEERFIYETQLLGLRPAIDERLGSVRVDRMRNVWIKLAANVWVSPPLTPLSDAQMDAATTYDAFVTPGTRRGLLESQQALTSDIIPPILQSFRAFQCRVMNRCAGVAVSPQGVSADGRITARLAGCIDESVAVPPSCLLTPLMSLDDPVTLPFFCQHAAEELIAFEQAQLLAIAHQDAAHRTLRQFAGQVERFFEVIRFPFVSPLLQVATFFRRWSRDVPCFLPYCRDPATLSGSTVPPPAVPPR